MCTHPKDTAPKKDDCDRSQHWPTIPPEMQTLFQITSQQKYLKCRIQLFLDPYTTSHICLFYVI